MTVAVVDAAPLLERVVGGDTGSPHADAVLAVVNNPVLVEAAHLLSVMDTLTWIFASGWLLTAALAVVLAGDRRRALRRLGTGLLVGGIVVGLTVLVARSVAGQGELPDVRAAVAATVTVFSEPLLRLAEVLAVLGAVVAVSAVSTPPTGPELGAASRLWARMVLQRRLVRGGAAVVLLLIGTGLLVDPLGAPDGDRDVDRSCHGGRRGSDTPPSPGARGRPGLRPTRASDGRGHRSDRVDRCGRACGRRRRRGSGGGSAMRRSHAAHPRPRPGGLQRCGGPL